MIVSREFNQPIRSALSHAERWHGADGGLIACWERGREKAAEDHLLADAARRGELVLLPWKGGLTQQIKSKNKIGTHQYYAMWLGLRGENLYINRAENISLTCTKFQTTVTFTGDYNAYANA